MTVLVLHIRHCMRQYCRQVSFNKHISFLFVLRLPQVPTVAVLGSGGGYRATAGFSAACCALEEIGLMDCVTYLTGLSGSAW